MALDIWDISYDPNAFTFIDLIKGIIPMSLTELLSSWTTKKNVVDVLIQMRQFIFNEIFEEVWIPRCSHLKEFERSMGLTKKKKLEFKSVRSLPSNNSSNNNIIHYDSLDSVRNYIYFGSILLSSAGRASTYQVLASVWEVVVFYIFYALGVRKKLSGDPFLRPSTTPFVDKFLSAVAISAGDLLPSLAIRRATVPATCGVA
ncbi:hypothetical protein RhiirB3_456657 [Rhizophagus irregularis]|nr:hypothetical protein RhiirB3_456657 [Rhizophagus irregularis]